MILKERLRWEPPAFEIVKDRCHGGILCAVAWREAKEVVSEQEAEKQLTEPLLLEGV
jgi:hypothetical protein